LCLTGRGGFSQPSEKLQPNGYACNGNCEIQQLLPCFSFTIML
jgi:hypothetical protein